MIGATIKSLALIVVLAVTGSGCAEKDLYSSKDFVGKWESSRVTTPVYLHDDGEWELKTEAGEVQQYGIWNYSNNQILWTVRVNGRIQHDPNPVVSMTATEFQLREKNGSVTTFHRL